MNKKSSTGILLCAVLSVIEGLQILIIAALISSCFPIGLSAYEQMLFAQSKAGLKPEREILLFRIFIVAAIAIQIALVSIFKSRLEHRAFERTIVRFIIVDGVLVAVQAFAAFKIFLYEDPWWARGILYAGIAAAVVLKIFWVEVWKGWRILALLPKGHAINRLVRVWGAGLGGLFIFICLFVPHIQHALLLVQRGGITTGLDRIVVALMPVIHGANYGMALQWIMWAVMAYWFLLYFFLRGLSGSWGIAFVGVVLAIKFNLFHAGMSPVFFAHPQGTVFDLWWDIVLFFMLARHIQKGGPLLLWGAAAVAGLMVAINPATGFYALMAFWIYLAIILCTSNLRKAVFIFPRDLAALKGCLYVPVLIGGLGIFLGHGNSAEKITLFLAGDGAKPAYACLWGRQFFAFDLIFILPVFYLVNIFWAVYRRELFLLFVATYALCLNLAFIVDSSISHYYVAAVPLVLILCLHGHNALRRLTAPRRFVCGIVVAGIAATALLTNSYFTYYPNVLNLARVDWKAQGALWQDNPDFQSDAAMLAGLTEQGSAVPVISRYEVPLLVMAGRKPFFPYTPIVNADGPMAPDVDATAVYTQDRLRAVTALLDSVKPAYIFIDPNMYANAKSPFMDYVREHYAPHARGLTIWALKRQ